MAGDRYPDILRLMLWVVVAFAHLLRHYHDVTEEFRPPGSPEWQLSYPDWRQYEVICLVSFLNPMAMSDPAISTAGALRS